MRPTNKEIIIKQVREWNERVWMKDIEPDRIDDKELTGKVSYEKKIQNKIDRLLIKEDWDNFFKDDKFHVAIASKNETIYKFARYGIERLLIYNKDISFARNSLFDAYIMTDGSTKDSYFYINELIEVIGSSYTNKYICIENLNTEFDSKTAIYFCSQLKRKGCKGIIMSCNKKQLNTLYSNIEKNKICEIFEIK